MSQARKLPDGFTEGMIMRHPSSNMMNDLARSVLSLYSYDPAPDDTSIENLLLQSVKLIGCFPSIVANSYAVKRHYFHQLHRGGSASAGHDADGPRGARRRQ